VDQPELIRTSRHLPHWDHAGSTYFITFRLKHGEMRLNERRLVCDHILKSDRVFYQLFALVVMPDHVHMLARPSQGIALSRMMKGTKGVTARLINNARNTRGPVWLGESYDRIIRDEAEAIEKQNYVIQNPVRAGIVEHWQDYPFVYRGRLW
jgi:REP element-mobilizing transposase RayT